MNVEHFVPLGSFRKTAGSIVRELRASRKAPGEERIYTAGEKAHGIAARVTAEGVEIPPGLQRSLNELRTELGLGNHDLGF
jgi:L-2-hydroxycarboxylate dehydrogenase (NAD+)